MDDSDYLEELGSASETVYFFTSLCLTPQIPSKYFFLILWVIFYKTNGQAEKHNLLLDQLLYVILHI